VDERVAATVAVTGPDGAGKSTVAARLVAEVLSQPLLHFHHRPGALPGRTVHAGPVTDPHGRAPYPPWLSLLKLVYLFLDYQMGRRALRKVRRAGGSILLERGWHDLVVDPRRYRLNPPRWAARLLSRLVPRPDLTVVLVAAPELLQSRKDELPLAELRRQVEAWERFAKGSADALLVDAATPVDQIVADIRRRLASPAQLPTSAGDPGDGVDPGHPGQPGV
jgi:adenylate kinase